MRQIFFAAATVATLFASPALAQSFDPSIGSGNIVTPYAGNQTVTSPARDFAVRAQRATDAFAQSNYHWPRYDQQGRDHAGW